MNKAKDVLFVGPDDIEDTHYEKCQCAKCGKTSYIDCGTTPSIDNILYYVNYEGWRFYLEYPMADEGLSDLVCPDCADVITGRYPGEHSKLHKHLQKGDLLAWMDKKNRKTMEKYDDR